MRKLNEDLTKVGQLTEDEQLRYSRQIRFAPIGEKGQLRLRHSRIAIVGAGALGAALANHMARAGVGYIRIIDRDFVEMSNLQRQMLFDEADARKMMPKAIAAAEKLTAINSTIQIEPHVADVTWQNAEELLTGVDLILDGTDNFAIRYLINDVSVKYGIPYVYGGIIGAAGTSALFVPGKTPCLACLFPEPPLPGSVETCDTAGVIGPIIHLITAFQATESLKYLVGDHEQLSGQLIHVDLWNNHFIHMRTLDKKDPSCPACVQHRFRFLEEQEATSMETVLCGRNTIQIRPAQPLNVDLDEMASRLAPHGKIEQNRFLVRLHLKTLSLVLFRDGRVLIQGTNDLVTARRLYAQYIGT